MPSAPQFDDIAALERERAAYELHGRTERVKQVSAQIERIRRAQRSGGRETATSPAPPERT